MRRKLARAAAALTAIMLTFTACPTEALFFGQITGSAYSSVTEIPEGYTAIRSLAELYAVRGNSDGKYILMNDIDLSDATKGGSWDSGCGWTPIAKFSGALDGNGHCIKNMGIYSTVPTDFCGLIGSLSGTVKNLRIENADIDNQKNCYVGAVAGCVDGGTIIGCSVSGKISSAYSFCGSLAGKIVGDGTVSQCYSSAAVLSLESNAGGICGYEEATENGAAKISDCYFNGTVSAKNLAGGIVGAVGKYSDDSNEYYSTVEKCFNLGTVSVKDDDGKCYAITSCEADSEKQLSYCYYSTESVCDGTENGDVYSKIQKLTPAQMKISSCYTGFDFTDTWTVDTAYGIEYPQLKYNKENVLIGIALGASPEKTEYFAGDKLDLTGAKISLSYMCGDSTDMIDITDDMLGEYDMEAVGTQSVTVTYCGYTCAFDINIKPIEAEEITISDTDISVGIGKSKTVTATFSPENTTDKTLTWTSDNEAVATVSQDGEITGVSAGTAVVECKSSNGLSGKCVVTVGGKADGILINKDKTDVYVGDTVKLEASLVPDSSDSVVSWTSDNEAVAVVSSDGTVSGISDGTAVITCEADGFTAQCTVTVIKHAETVSLDKSEISLVKGDTYKLATTFSPDNSYENTEWSSDNTDVATVSEDGTVTAVDKGEAVITVKTSNGLTASCTVTVANTAKGISLDKTDEKVDVGKSFTLAATLTPSDAEEKITWSSDNTDVATVSENGTVTAISKGTAVITAETESGFKAECTVTVLVPSTEISLDKSEVELYKDNTLLLNATLTPNNSTDKLKWASSDSTVVSVSDSGLCRALKNGKAVITVVSESGQTASCTITVKVHAKSISLNASSISISYGKTYTLKPVVSPSDYTDKITWKSSNTKICTVSASGVVKAVSKGSAVISATVNGMTAKCTVNVKIPATKITVNVSSATIVVGNKKTLSAKLTPLSSTDSVSWSSSSASVASVSSKGVVTAKKVGTAYITAKATSGVFVKCKITVKGIKAKSVKLNKKTATVKKGKTLTLKATVNPTNTTDKLSWKTSNKNVATVSSKGVVKAVGKGKAVISAVINRKTAKCTITVPKTYTSSIKISKTSANLNVGSKLTLTRKINPSGSDEGASWSSSNLSVCSIKISGQKCIVTGKKSGTAVITVKSGKKTSTCKVKVVKKTLKPSISVKMANKKFTTYSVGFTFTNKGSKNIKILTGGKLTNEYHSSYNRKLTLIGDGPDYPDLSSRTVFAKGTTSILFRVTNRKKTTRDNNSIISFYFTYDGVKYLCKVGYNYGVTYSKV